MRVLTIRGILLKDSRLVGYLSLKDITHVLALRGP